MNTLIRIEGEGGVPMFLDTKSNMVLMSDGAGGYVPHEQLVQMDIGPGDVHVVTALANFCTGFKQAAYIQDLASPPVPVDHQRDKYWQFSADNELAPTNMTAGANSSDIPEVSPSFSNTEYVCTPYALASFLSTETLANEDAILQLQRRYIRLIMQKLLLNREVRVRNTLFNASNYSASHKISLGGTEKWNGGSASDPIENINRLRQQSLAPITHMLMDFTTWNAFATNANVQKYVAFKSAATPLPHADARAAWAALLDIPIPVVCEAKVKNTAGAYPYIWAGSVALVHQEPGIPADGMSTATMKTFRWKGSSAALPDQTQTAIQGGQPGLATTGGWTVRVLFNPFRGPRGGLYMVVAHDDADQFITDQVSGLIAGVIQ